MKFICIISLNSKATPGISSISTVIAVFLQMMPRERGHKWYRQQLASRAGIGCNTTFWHWDSVVGHRSLLHYSGEGPLPAEDSRMSGAISVPMPMGGYGNYQDLGA